MPFYRFVVLTGLRYSCTLTCTTETTACRVPSAHRFATAYIRLCRKQEYKVRFALSRFATTPLSLLLYARGQSSFCTQVCYCTSIFAAVCKRTKFVLHTGLLRTSVFAAVCRRTKFVLHTGLLRTSVFAAVCRRTKFVLHTGLLLHILFCCMHEYTNV